MRYRKLRIAWSVFWGLAAVLLIGLWVRSYSRLLDLYGSQKNHAFVFTSMKGEFCFIYFNPEPTELDSRDLTDDPLTPLQRVLGTNTYWLKWSRWSPPPNSRGLWIRHWLVLLMCIIALAAPWFRWRFSLRTLLIATTLVAVVLGLVVWVAGD